MLTFSHPKQHVSIELKNKEVKLGQYEAILSAYIILGTDSFEKAESESLEYLKEFVDMLTFTTNMHFSIGNILKVVDWSLGVEERQCLIYHKFPGDERPYPVLDESLLSTIEFLLNGNIGSRLKRALRWFSNGVSSKYLDEQFQCFWFVVEILAQEVKPTEKVHDPCPQCREALYCPKCGKTPSHKPYAKQAIEHLFSLVVKGDNGKAFEISNKFRNALMHGDPIEDIEKEIGVKLSYQIDILGKTAWYSILNILKNAILSPSQKAQLHLIQTNSYCDIEMHLKTKVSYKCRDPQAPCVSEIPEFNVELVKNE